MTGPTRPTPDAVPSPRLPPEFPDLERFAPIWALPSATERYQRRLDSTIGEMQEFYDAVRPRAEDAIVHLDRFDLDDLPTEELHLLWMLCSLSAVGFAVDCFKQPAVPDIGDVRLDFDVEPAP